MLPKGGLLTTAWPRLLAHATVLLLLGAIWALPRTASFASAPASGGRPGMEAPLAADPLTAMAERPRTVARLRMAATAFEQVSPPTAPKPHVRSTARRRVPTPTAVHVVAPPPAPPPNPAQPGWGNDISWPQCAGGYPGAHDVGVVGVTGGRPFTSNPCLGSEWAWAQASTRPGGAQTYLNLEVGGTSDGPQHCAGDNTLCRAYDYGWVSFTDSSGRASQSGVNAPFWWLDVEVGNDWSDNLLVNSYVIQGAIDAAKAYGIPVGIYSSADQWAEIVPGEYRPGVPTWLAVVGDSGMAPGLCAPQFSLTGGPVYLVQFDDHTFDSDHVCAAGAATFAAAARR